MDIRGSFHCGNLRYLLAWPGEPVSITARTCDCNFCTRHGAAWTSHLEASLRITINQPRSISRYAFATRTADFLIWNMAWCRSA